MDAIVLVGGLGTRLRPLTETRHKSLVPVRNRPAIEHLFDWARRSGIERVVLALGRHNGDLAAAYRAGLPSGPELLIVEERERLESGGAIRNAVHEANVEGRFAVLNGDVFVEFDFQAALAEHVRRRADLSLALYPVADPSNYGVAVVEDGLITGFVEKPPPGEAPGNLVNAGVWIFEAGLVAEIPPGPVRVEETLFPSLVAARRTVLGFEFGGIWADIGTPERYLELNRALCASLGSSAVGAGTYVSASAVLTDSAIGAESDVRDSSVVRDSIAWESVTIGAGAMIKDCILADRVQVGDGAILNGVVAGSNARIAPGAVLPANARLQPGETYGF